MADETNVTQATDEVNNENMEYSIEVASHEPFDFITRTAYIDSAQLCKKVNNIFKQAFGDCVGSTFDTIPGTNMYTLSLYFDHINHGDNAVTAVSKDADADATKNNTLRRTRSYMHRLYEGDRYHVTAEGRSALTPFIYDQNVMRHIYKGVGGKTEINWEKVVFETADSTGGYGAAPQQLTKITFIDPVKIIELIYGKDDGEGHNIVYGVKMLRSLPSFFNNGQSSYNYLLAIDSVREDQVVEMCNKFGIGYQPGLNIIR